jgi:hypothetical protein
MRAHFLTVPGTLLLLGGHRKFDSVESARMGADAYTLCCNGLVSPRIQLNVFADSPSRVIDCEEIRYVVEPTSSVDTGGVGDD